MIKSESIIIGILLGGVVAMIYFSAKTMMEAAYERNAAVERTWTNLTASGNSEFMKVLSSVEGYSESSIKAKVIVENEDGKFVERMVYEVDGHNEPSYGKFNKDDLLGLYARYLSKKCLSESVKASVNGTGSDYVGESFKKIVFENDDFKCFANGNYEIK